PLGDPTDLHEVTSQDEERNRHEREGVQRDEHLLRNDFEPEDARGANGHRRGPCDRHGDRRTYKEQDDRTDDETCHRRSPPSLSVEPSVESPSSRASRRRVSWICASDSASATSSSISDSSSNPSATPNIWWMVLMMSRTPPTGRAAMGMLMLTSVAG